MPRKDGVKDNHPARWRGRPQRVQPKSTTQKGLKQGKAVDSPKSRRK